MLDVRSREETAGRGLLGAISVPTGERPDPLPKRPRSGGDRRTTATVLYRKLADRLALEVTANPAQQSKSCCGNGLSPANREPAPA